MGFMFIIYYEIMLLIIFYKIIKQCYNYIKNNFHTNVFIKSFYCDSVLYPMSKV